MTKEEVIAAMSPEQLAYYNSLHPDAQCMYELRVRVNGIWQQATPGGATFTVLRQLSDSLDIAELQMGKLFNCMALEDQMKEAAFKKAAEDGTIIDGGTADPGVE